MMYAVPMISRDFIRSHTDPKVREELEREARAETAEKDRQEHIDLTLELYEEERDINSDEMTSINGRFKKKPLPRHSNTHSTTDAVTFAAMIEGTGNAVRDIWRTLAAIWPVHAAHPESKTAAPEKIKFQHEDEKYYYGTEVSISEATEKILSAERAQIETKLQILGKLSDTYARHSLAKEIERLAISFDMALLVKSGETITPAYGEGLHLTIAKPDTKIRNIFHSITRAEELEHQCRLNNNDSGPRKLCNVFVWEAKGHVSSLRGIKVQLGDQYNNDVAEVIDAKAHVQAPQPPSPK